MLVLSILSAGPISAGDVPEWVQRTKLSGYVFGDAYWMAQNHDLAVEDANGFWFRRIYLTFDYAIGDNLSARLRFEGNSPGDFTSSDNIEPFVKDAYVRWKNDRRSIYLGISGTPTWGVVEEAWGYRAVEKTPLDLQKLGSSRDFGVAVKGRFGKGSKLGYHLMLGNGSGTKGETNQDKKAMLALGYYPASGWTVELYGDVDARPGAADRVTLQAFAAYRAEWGRIGIQAARQSRERASGEDLDLDLASLFAVFEVSERISLLGRIDRMFDPNPDGAGVAYLPFDPTAESTLLLLGVDYQVDRRFSLIPNLEYVAYDGVGGAPDPDGDLMARLTFFFRF
ncbi:MAG: hypothetical protein D6696_13740 [Acidobacteria bacterium]|nr:MAG: hypothetical protein D6696_13740 [Acidobacteriota bacterium]